MTENENKKSKFEDAQNKIIDDTQIVYSIKSGEVKLLPDTVFDAFILEDGKRVFSQRGAARVWGLTGGGATAFPRMVNGKNISAYLTKKNLEDIDNPVYFKTSDMNPPAIHHGYEVTLIIDVCHAIVTAWEEDKLAPNQESTAKRALAILKATSKLGIISLVDSTLGYVPKEQEYKQAYESFLLKEASAWIKEFPDEFYDMFYKFYGIVWNKHKNHPSFFGSLTNKFVYTPLAHSNGYLLRELKDRNSDSSKRLHQFLSNEGKNSLRSHLWQLIGIGKISRDKSEFERNFSKVFGEDYQLKLF